MIRRKLTAYTVAYVAGITAGFFMLDRGRHIEAAGLMLAASACIFLFDSETESKKDKAMLFAMLLSGFLTFTLHSCLYDSSAAYAGSTGTLTGKVMSAELRDGTLRMTVRTFGTGTRKILVNVPGYMPEDRGSNDDQDTPEPYELTGASIEATGEFSELLAADNPGCFDYRVFMRGKGISLSMKVYSFEIKDPGNDLISMTKRKLYRAREDFLSHFDEGTSGFIRGVVFGDKSEIDEDTIREFNGNSTGHILAVSGLHIGFLYGLLKALTGRKRTAGISMLIIAVTFMYGEMTMWSASTVRACLVMGISLISLHLNRPSDLLTSVSLAAFLILLKEPYQLFSAGFQMSFLAMCGIAFLTKPISSVTGETLGAMMAVQLGTLPVTAYTFYRFDPLAVFINIPVILLASVLVPLCILMLIIMIISGTAPGPGLALTELISNAVIRINHLLSFNGEFSLKAAGIRSISVTAVYIAMLGLSSEWARVNLLRKRPGAILKSAVLILMPLMMLASCMSDPFSDDAIVFVAVGQGDCVHVRADDRDLLIDGGGSEYINVGDRILMPYLLHEGSENVDMALVTHLHADHYKGIEELAAIYPVGAIGVPSDYRESLDAGGSEESGSGEDSPDESGPSFGGKVFYIVPGTKVSLSNDVYVEPIWPVEESAEPIAADDPNEHNMVYMIHYKGIKVMVTGDLLEADELEMVDHYKGTDVLDCDVLKVAHHGSKSSSTEAFLDAVSPEIAVIQCGRNNIYRHPHSQTLDRLEERGIPVYRTDTNGAVGLDISGNRIKVDLFNGNDND